MIFVSVFGPQFPDEGWWLFSETWPAIYASLKTISEDKPIYVGELGVTEFPERPHAKATWLDDAFLTLARGSYPRLRGFGYWHERPWEAARFNNLKIDSTASALAAYRKGVSRQRSAVCD